MWGTFARVVVSLAVLGGRGAAANRGAIEPPSITADGTQLNLRASDVVCFRCSAVLPLKLPHPVDGHAVAAIDHLLFVFGGDLNEGKDRSENRILFPLFVLKSDRFTKTG